MSIHHTGRVRLHQAPPWTSLLGLGFFALASCGGASDSGVVYVPAPAPSPSPTPTPTPAATAFSSRMLVSNVPGATAIQDPNLSHGWGVAFGAGPAWITAHASDKSVLYDGNGVVNPLVVSFNSGGDLPGPTGIVANTNPAFTVSQGGITATAAFLFVGTGGVLWAWSPTVDRLNAIKVFDGRPNGDIYTGLATFSRGATNLVFATNLRRATVDTFDASYTKIALPGRFADPQLPANYFPFGIQTIGDEIFVSYARITPGQPPEDHGPGLGVINVFDSTGTLLRRLVREGGALNAPWGMALAPANFGSFSNALLVGNFGDGKINAYNPTNGAFLGTLKGANGAPIVNPGLWGIAFGNDAPGQPKNTLFFAAGPSQTQGVFGRIEQAP